MMFTLSKGNVTTFQGDTHDFVYIVSSVEKMNELGYLFAFTDGHALMKLSSFYNDLAHISTLDWSVLGAAVWKNTDTDNDRSRRRQAEFLVKSQVGVEAFKEVAVYSAEMAKRTTELTQKHQLQIAVSVKKSWYY
jgi:hypothetical protein